jgi:hypothetical protein
MTKSARHGMFTARARRPDAGDYFGDVGVVHQRQRLPLHLERGFRRISSERTLHGPNT